VTLAIGQIVIRDIDDFDPSSGQINCTSTPQNVSPPGWEWNCDPAIQNGNYMTCSSQSVDICGKSDWSTTQRRDNQSREADLSWHYSLPSGIEYGGQNFHAAINSSGNGNLDQTDTHFSYDVWVYYTDLTNINQLEFDLNQVLDNGDHTTDVIQFATQCNLSPGNFGSYFDAGLSGYWNYTVNQGTKWVKEPNIPCKRSDWTENTWHHVVVSFHRGAHTSKGHDIVYYDSVSFDGTEKNFSSNAYSNQAISGLGWSPAGLLVTNFQLDMGFTQDGQMTAYADLMTVNSPEETQVATPTFSPPGGGPDIPPFFVTISTSTQGATICYTTDGTTPTANGGGTCTHGTTYSTPVYVVSGETLEAVASEDGIDFDSSIASATY
jgi:Chitobiase/beta-hexosaminidase C-terminal domain